MARPREFDPDAALESAMQLFWSQGYEATSLDDLCAATSLSRSSLYATFGDKRALLLKSIDRYTDERIAAFLGAALARPMPIRKVIETFFDELIQRIVAGRADNCAAEPARDDREAAARRGRASKPRFAIALARAKAGRDRRRRGRAGVPDVRDAGLAPVGKANRDRDTLEDIKGGAARLDD
jgi:TetR/AcrR family transcriptional repressor of nem operon